MRKNILIFFLICILLAITVTVIIRNQDNYVSVNYSGYSINNIDKHWTIAEKNEAKEDPQRGMKGNLIFVNDYYKVSFTFAEKEPKIGNAYQPMLYNSKDAYKTFIIDEIPNALAYCRLIENNISTQCKIVYSDLRDSGLDSYFTDWFGELLGFNRSQILIYSSDQNLTENDINEAIKLINAVASGSVN